MPRPPSSPLFPYTTLFRSPTPVALRHSFRYPLPAGPRHERTSATAGRERPLAFTVAARYPLRSEEHTSELQSLRHLVCRLLLEKKKKTTKEQLQAATAIPH